MVLSVFVSGMACADESRTLDYFVIAEAIVLHQKEHRQLDTSATIAHKLLSDSSYQKRLGITITLSSEDRKQIKQTASKRASKTYDTRNTDPDLLEKLLFEIVSDKKALAREYFQMEGLASLARQIYVSLKIISPRERTKVQSRAPVYMKSLDAVAAVQSFGVDNGSLENEIDVLIKARDLSLISALDSDTVYSLAQLLKDDVQNQQSPSESTAEDGP